MRRLNVPKICNGRLIDTRIIYKGLPQGSKLSPLLFILYIRKILHTLGPNIRSLQYADDIAIYTNNNNLTTGTIHLQEAASRLDDWLSSIGLDISPQKCEFIIFSRKKRIFTEPTNIIIKNHKIYPQNKAKFLGVVLDYSMTWKPFINSLKTKARLAINILKCIFKLKWGADPRTLLNFSNAFIRSILEWGFIATSNASPSLKSLLNREYGISLKISLGLCKSVPLNVVLLLSGQLSLDARRTYLIDRFLLKTKSILSHPLIPKLKNFTTIRQKNKPKPRNLPYLYTRWEKISKKSPNIYTTNLPLPYEYPFPAQFSIRKINFKIGECAKASQSPNDVFFRLLNDEFEGHIPLFTDGSKSLHDKDTEPDQAGYSIFSDLLKINISNKCDPSFSIFSIEAWAIREALKIIRSTKHKNFVICTDSKSVLQALNKYGLDKSHNYILLDTKLQLDLSLLDGKNVVLCWCPAHIGISGNEMADHLAKNPSGESINSPPLLSDALLPCRAKAIKQTNKLINKLAKQNKGKYICSLIPHFKPLPWFAETTLNRPSILIINRIRSGHFLTKPYLYKIGKVDSPLCECQKAIQTLNHSFWSCDLSKHLTEQLTSRLISIKYFPPYEIVSLTCSTNDNILKWIVEFVIKANLNV